ncbi:MAG: glycosyltransferase family 2 protein, partial [Myxococcota bacterium]
MRRSMQNAPDISILLPVFDGAATLGPCLRSISRQTLSSWECVLVDDGSRDGSRQLAAVGCHVRLFPRSPLGPGMRRYERWLNTVDSRHRVRVEAFVECPIAHPTLLIRLPVLRALGYRDAGWPEDYDLFLRLLAEGHAGDIVPRRLLSKRHGSNTFSQSDGAYSPERFTACKAAFLARSFLAAAPRSTSAATASCATTSAPPDPCAG